MPIGLVGMVLRRGKKSSMLNGWDSGVRVRGVRGILEVDCDWARVNYDEGESGVTILMSHGYCMDFRDSHLTDSSTQPTDAIVLNGSLGETFTYLLTTPC